MKASTESSQDQLQLARAQGAAYAQALQAMDKESGAQLQRAGDYEIALVVEEAEGLWEMQAEGLHWVELPDDNAHIEVAVRDASDGRFIPGLSVVVTVTTDDGQNLGTQLQEFLWHPWIYHYGRNWKLPGDGIYQIRVQVEPPHFARHDRKNGRRYTTPVDVTFTREIKVGEKQP